MPSILPYKEGIKKSDGAFILPNNKIELVNSHMRYAIEYIRGEDFETLCDLQRKGYDDEDEKYKKECFNKYVKDHNLPWKTRDDIDPFISSTLSDEERKIFNIWEEEFEFRRKDLYSDFLLYFLGIDKLQTVMRMAITTTEQYPYIKYFNYLLMDFKLDEQFPKKYNEERKRFGLYNREQSIVLADQDRKYRDEIEELKSKIPVKDRHLYFK